MELGASRVLIPGPLMAPEPIEVPGHLSVEPHPTTLDLWLSFNV